MQQQQQALAESIESLKRLSQALSEPSAAPHLDKSSATSRAPNGSAYKQTPNDAHVETPPPARARSHFSSTSSIVLTTQGLLSSEEIDYSEAAEYTAESSARFRSKPNLQPSSGRDKEPALKRSSAADYRIRASQVSRGPSRALSSGTLGFVERLAAPRPGPGTVREPLSSVHQAPPFHGFEERQVRETVTRNVCGFWRAFMTYRRMCSCYSSE